MLANSDTKDLIGKGYHILAKPRGAMCNLKCEYCFYLEKENLYKKNLYQENNFIMSDEVLESYIDKYINTQDIPLIQFVWQGGEPMLAGIDFYEKVIELQKKYNNKEKEILNSIQTNGILLDDEWCEFLKENNFLVGLSFDGDREIHNKYRYDKNGNGTYDVVCEKIKLLKKYKIDFNVLVCVTSKSSKKPKEIYNNLKNLGVEFIQFTPIVERMPKDNIEKMTLNNRSANDLSNEYELSSFSIKQGEYGSFLIEVFDEWVSNDVGKINVMNFEWALESWLGLPSTICVFSKNCGKALAIEHNGDLYSCDHFVYKENKIGNIIIDNPRDLIEREKQKSFGYKKEDLLPNQCMECEVKFACNGECPRHRFEKTFDGEENLSYLCSDYKKYFHHIHRYMKVMVQLINNNLSPTMVMEVIKNGSVVVKK